MIQANKQHTIGALIAMGIAALLLFLFDEERPKPSYYLNQGKIFGTYYTIRYEATEDLEDSIQAELQAFDNSLSMFNPHSTLSAINDNRDTVTDALFEAMFAEAARVNALSDRAFDITVAPLVNYWGFGRSRGSTPKHAIRHSIDSLRTFVGFDKVQLVNHRVIKSDPRVQLDGGAVAKGQSCDIIASLLERQGCTNYLVEIGGEIVSRGVNAKGEPWHIGITKPIDERLVDNRQTEMQEVIAVNDICMATSGNYRNFYYDGEQKRSHTIDPRTGYPVQHSLLSATVVSSSCMRADALATACMVLGADKAIEMIARAGDAACYLIVDEDGEMVVRTSENWKEKIGN